jgi:hypothetical protein
VTRAQRLLSPADLGWDGPVGLRPYWDQLADPDRGVPFGEVVKAHWDSVSEKEKMARREASAAQRALTRRFLEREGEIRNSFFCRHTPGGAMVTWRQPAEVRRGVRRRADRRVEPARRLHTVLNSSVAELVQLEADCHLLAEQAAAAFGREAGAHELEVATDSVYSVMTRVLSAADTCARPTSSDVERVAAIVTAQTEYRAAAARVTAMIQRQSRFIYFLGCLLGSVAVLAMTALIGLATARWWTGIVSTPALVAAGIFGALGAVTSVFQRMSSGQLVLDFNASRTQTVLLGALRPLVGAVSGTVVQFALVGGLLGGAGSAREPRASFGFFALIGFAAGFSERWATDMVETAGRAIAANPSVRRQDDAATAAASRAAAAATAATTPPPTEVRRDGSAGDTTDPATPTGSRSRQDDAAGATGAATPAGHGSPEDGIAAPPAEVAGHTVDDRTPRTGGSTAVRQDGRTNPEPAESGPDPASDATGTAMTGTTTLPAEHDTTTGVDLPARTDPAAPGRPSSSGSATAATAGREP